MDFKNEHLFLYRSLVEINEQMIGSKGPSNWQGKMKRIIVFLLIGLIIGGAVVLHEMTNKKNTIRVAFGSPWGTIHPGLQHTLVGDLVLSNQFEALIGMNEFGVSVPLAAKSWEASDDYKEFTFHIDTEKTFSNGEKLTAMDFKRSWEKALALEPTSSNSSLLDVMYKIQGFENFQKTKTLSGIEVVDNATLRVHFGTPFRMALAHFQGNRFSAFKEAGNRFLGTGKYVIEENSDHSVHFNPNSTDSEAKFLQPIEVTTVRTDEAVDKLIDGSIDVFAYGKGSSVSPSIKEKKKISIVIGQDALHETAILNLMPGRFFQNVQYRRAMQYLIHEKLSKSPHLLGNPDYSAVDGQVFLPLQTGRIHDDEVSKIIEDGKRLVPELIAATKREPLVVYVSEENNWLIPFLKEVGISVSPKSKKIAPPERISVIYKTFEPDIIEAAFGVASGDPDGIYHRLGKSGAITTPMGYSEHVSQLLEEGRSIVKQEDLDPFYQKVSRAILAEVPFVHMGCSKAIAIYRNDIIEFDSKLLRRNEGHLHGFRLR